MNKLEEYRPRRVEPRGLVDSNGRFIKIYTVTYKSNFEASDALENAVAHIPDWLDRPGPKDFRADDFGFLIVHEGRDGNWTLFFRWIEGHMLHSQTFFSRGERILEQNPREGSMACIWELPIIDFERRLWVESMFGRELDEGREIYLGDQLSGEV